jgi:ribosomal protein L7Ae-like RNA K-turn-binding protein
VQNRQKILNGLGLALRAGKIVSGEDAVIKAMQTNQTKLIFLANDASDAIKDKLDKKAHFYNTKIINIFNAEELSKSIGKLHRKAIAICDEGFTNLILGYIERGDLHEG